MPSGALDWTSQKPQVIGGTNISFAGIRVHTNSTEPVTENRTRILTISEDNQYKTRYLAYFHSTMPWTTGMLEAFQAGTVYVSTAVQTGYDNRTENRLMGSLSLVVPWLTHEYVTSFNPTDPITSTGHNGRINRMTVHFLPEPAGIMLLGAGIIGLASAHRLWRR